MQSQIRSFVQALVLIGSLASRCANASNTSRQSVVLANDCRTTITLATARRCDVADGRWETR